MSYSLVRVFRSFVDSSVDIVGVDIVRGDDQDFDDCS